MSNRWTVEISRRGNSWDARPASKSDRHQSSPKKSAGRAQAQRNVLDLQRNIGILQRNMAKPPTHMVCGTAHWSTERCPAQKARPTETAAPAKRPAPRPEKKSEALPPAATSLAHEPIVVTPGRDLDAEGWRVRAMNAEAELARLAERERARVERHRAKQKGTDA